MFYSSFGIFTAQKSHPEKACSVKVPGRAFLRRFIDLTPAYSTFKRRFKGLAIIFWLISMADLSFWNNPGILLLNLTCILMPRGHKDSVLFLAVGGVLVNGLQLGDIVTLPY